MKKLILDAGHGGSDPGATSKGLKEKDFTRQIVQRIKEKLSVYNVQVLETRCNDEKVTLEERCRMANLLNADLFVSVHINAGGGMGYESYIHRTVSNDIKHKRMQTYFHNQKVFKDRGKKSANFQVLRDTKMSAILTENGFIDNENDVQVLRTKIDEIADYHVYGIVKTLELQEVDQTVYYIKTGTVRGRKEAEKVAKKIKNLGYLATIVKG